MSENSKAQKIKVTEDGPYEVPTSLNLVHKTQITSEHGEPMTWRTDGDIEMGDDDAVYLCRCGGSSNKPFCDGTHNKIDFDGKETAATNTFEERKEVHEGSTKIIIKRDYSICAESGYCGHRLANIKKLAKETDESIVRSQVMAMIERCPSGSYAYSLDEESDNIEPDMPKQVAVCTEMTDEGPILGPLWVTGNVEIERADGEYMETRNRVTLCRCGFSNNKPLCDGAHRKIGVKS